MKGSCEGSYFPLCLLLFLRRSYRAKGEVMEDRGGADVMARVGGERDDEEMTRERLFTVGGVCSPNPNPNF